MKKLMFAAAAMTAGFAMADVTSANIVGYQNIDLAVEGSIVAPTFAQVADGTFQMQALKPIRTGEDAIEDSDLQLQTLDEYGETLEMFYYLISGRDGEGWYSENDLRHLAEYEFDFGEGIILTCPYADAQFVHSGEVDTTDDKVYLPQEGSILGNTRPVALDLQEVEPIRTSGEDIEDSDLQLQTLDEYGETLEMFYYLVSGRDGAGWYSENDLRHLAELTLAPGEAIIMTCPYDDCYLQLPKVIED